ncbi:hypothetical protein CHUAL_012390 [Chamberlinius hualienensis]
MGSSCSSGPKKDKCSKKKKTRETNGGNHSQRGSDTSVYKLHTETVPTESTLVSLEPSTSAPCPNVGSGTGMAGPSTSTTTITGHEKVKVERLDSTSVSSPMSPNQLLTRQASREGTELEIGRIDLSAIPTEVTTLLTGNELKRLTSSGQLVDEVETREKDVFQPSFRCLNVVISRHETEGPKDEITSFDDGVIQPLRDHCRRKGYEVQLFDLGGDVSSEDWGWLCDEREAPLTVFILLCSESSAPENEKVHSWTWLANNIILKAILRRKAVAIWKHIIQSPIDLSENQQKLLETLDEARILKCSVKFNGDGKSSIAGQIHSMKSNLLTMITPMVDMMLDENERKDPTALGQPHYIGLSHSLYTELVNQFRLLQSYLKWYANNLWPSDLVQRVDDYVWSVGERHPLVLYGSSGKSCLQAYLAYHLANSDNSAHLVFRIIAQQQQTRFLSVFNNLIEQCCLLLAQPKPSSIEAADLPVLSRVSPPETPLILLLDGLENVLPSYPSFTWLPTTLPCNVRIIITLNNTSPLLDHLRSTLPTEAFLQIPAMVPENLCDIISKHLRNKQMDLSEPQQQVCHGAFRVNPSLSSVSILISAILLGRIPSTPSLQVESSLESQAEVLLASLEEELDPLFLSSFLCFLVLSKHGLSRLELASIMSPQFTALPPLELFQSIQRLVGWLEPALIGTIILHSTCLLTINCPHFRSAIRKRYLNPGLQPQVEEKYRLHLKQFWEKQNNLQRKWGELRDDKPIKIDPQWFLMKLKYGSVEDLIEELQTRAESQFSQQDVANFVDFLTEIYQVLEYDGEQFFTQVYGRSSLPNKPSVIIKQLLDQCVQSGFPCNSFVSSVGSGALRLAREAVESTTPETSQQAQGPESHVSSIHCMKNNPAFMVSLNVNKNEVIIWNVYEQKAVRTLRGIPQPRDIKFIDDRRAVILCNRELCIYDLDAGTFQVKLKGVMNQKMPFYGLHNSEHVVSLSRNRMYVNMMNLNSGDCVATFKVGEDRFLNSLLVSADGSICVCGDETQKPFPLLVWDLTSRKLMYDLRVPLHDFVTSLSAISSDGHFVICVCQEVSDPIPNFVIVYDLQNGTLFKKWKPEVSTCSVAISSEGGCAITGLTNTSVLVWDLITGACRFTLVGHTAPVSVIQLDQKGQRCLTADLPRCRDPAIRLWDLSKGVCLASYASAESYIISCQLSMDGHYIVLSLSDRSDIITLMLVEAGNSVKSLLPTTKVYYGNPEDEAKVVNFE